MESTCTDHEQHLDWLRPNHSHPGQLWTKNKNSRQTTRYLTVTSRYPPSYLIQNPRYPPWPPFCRHYGSPSSCENRNGPGRGLQPHGSEAPVSRTQATIEGGLRGKQAPRSFKPRHAGVTTRDRTVTCWFVDLFAHLTYSFRHMLAWYVLLDSLFDIVFVLAYRYLLF